MFLPISVIFQSPFSNLVKNKKGREVDFTAFFGKIKKAVGWSAHGFCCSNYRFCISAPQADRR
jgi:hypothetical protein